MEPERDLFFLWHLEHLGVLTRQESGWSAPLWDAARDAERPVTVAIVDTGLDPEHPNLMGALNAGLQVDFASRLHGAVYAPQGRALNALLRARDLDPATLRDLVKASLNEAVRRAEAGGFDLDRLRRLCDAVATAEELSPAVAEYLAALRVPAAGKAPAGFKDVAANIVALGLPEDMAGELSKIAKTLEAGYERIDVADPAQFFGAHGTACAGLVGGRPASAEDHPFFGALPYHGVNPFCRIRSYATPYGHEIQPVTHALLAAYLDGAEVILLPRGVADIEARGKLPGSARRETRIETGIVTPDLTLVPEDQADQSRLQDAKATFEALLHAVARQRYLVLASGNEGMEDRVAYPASIFGTEDTALIVGAVNRRGYSASYSNGAALGDRILHAVSDDGTVVDRTRVRIDIDTRDGSDYDFDPHIPDGTPNLYSPWAPLSLDVRGSYGYAASARRDPPEHDSGVDVGSLYTLFGGTSAASAIVAGAVSLLIQANLLPRRTADRSIGSGAAAVRKAAAEGGLIFPDASIAADSP